MAKESATLSCGTGYAGIQVEGGAEATISNCVVYSPPRKQAWWKNALWFAGGAVFAVGWVGWFV